MMKQNQNPLNIQTDTQPLKMNFVAPPRGAPVQTPPMGAPTIALSELGIPGLDESLLADTINGAQTMLRTEIDEVLPPISYGSGPKIIEMPDHAAGTRKGRRVRQTKITVISEKVPKPKSDQNVMTIV